MALSSQLFVFLLTLQVLIIAHLCMGRPRRVRRIVHGYPAEKHEFPWSVSFVFFRDGEIRYCGGSILDEQWLLTAAHCFIKYGNITQVDLSADSWLVRLGTNAHWSESQLWKYDMAVDPQTGQYVHDLKIAQIVSFPDFNPHTVVHDIALVRLEKKLDFSGPSNIQPVRLPTEALMQSVGVGTRCTMSGWGCTAREAFIRRSGDGPARHQRKATMYLFYPSVCQWLYGPFMNSDTDLCAISRRRHVNLCGGDSGGPLICYGEDGQPFQAGIASGVFTKSPFWRGNPPAIFTKVSRYLEWIVDVTTRHRPDHCPDKKS